MVAASLLPLTVLNAGDERVADSAWTTGTRRVLAMLIKFPAMPTRTPGPPPRTGFSSERTASRTLRRSVLRRHDPHGRRHALDDGDGRQADDLRHVHRPESGDGPRHGGRLRARELRPPDLRPHVPARLRLGRAGLRRRSRSLDQRERLLDARRRARAGAQRRPPHSHSLNCAGSTYGANCEPVGTAGKVGTRSEYGDLYDTMGNSRAAHFNAYQKSVIDWMPAGSIATHASGAADYDLSPFEGTTGTRAVKIPTTARTFWLEWRQPIGFDSGIGTGGTGGPLLHIGRAASGEATFSTARRRPAATLATGRSPSARASSDAVSSLVVTTVSKTASTLRSTSSSASRRRPPTSPSRRPRPSRDTLSPSRTRPSATPIPGSGTSATGRPRRTEPGPRVRLRRQLQCLADRGELLRLVVAGGQERQRHPPGREEVLHDRAVPPRRHPERERTYGARPSPPGRRGPFPSGRAAASVHRGGSLGAT